MKWIYKRLITAFLTVFTTSNIIFFLIRLLPGNIIDALINEYIRLGMSYTDAYRLLSANFGFQLNEPLHEQYIDYMVNLFTGNLGYSMAYNKMPVISIIAQSIPWTVFTVSIGTITAFFAGILIGLLAAYKHGSFIDRFITFFSTVSAAIPNYIIAYFLIIIFVINFRKFPIAGAYDAATVSPGFNIPFIASVLRHAFLPILSYFIAASGSWILYMRGNTVSVLGEDYVMAAKARGLKSTRIVLMYVGRNAILPLFTILAINLGYILGGSTLIESVFVYPGIGFFISQSVRLRDHSLMQGLFFILTVSITVSNLLADLLYSKLDPRVRFE